MKFARWIFAVAGVCGLMLIGPLYFAETQIGRVAPPPITHPEYFYGFIGVTLARQAVFLLIAGNPVRYRPVMLAAVGEKLTYGPAAIVLFVLERAGTPILGFGLIDLLWAALFLAAFQLTPHPAAQAASANR